MERAAHGTPQSRTYLAPTINAFTAQLSAGVRQYNEMVTAAAQLVSSANADRRRRAGRFTTALPRRTGRRDRSTARLVAGLRRTRWAAATGLGRQMSLAVVVRLVPGAVALDVGLTHLLVALTSALVDQIRVRGRAPAACAGATPCSARARSTRTESGSAASCSGARRVSSGSARTGSSTSTAGTATRRIIRPVAPLPVRSLRTQSRIESGSCPPQQYRMN